MNTLSTLLREKIIQENISEREASRQIGVSPTTIARVLSGDLPDLTTMIAMCDWLGVSVSRYWTPPCPARAPSWLKSGYLEAKPELTRVFVDAMTYIMENDVSPEVISRYSSVCCVQNGNETTKSDDHNNE